VLFLSPLTLQRVVGRGAAEGEALLAALTAHAFAQLDCMMRHELVEGDVVMWDNRATMHLAPVGSPPIGSARQVFRVTCRGQPLLAPDGRPSRLVGGAPILSAREELQMTG
jgi:taurine dioxygenase